MAKKIYHLPLQDTLKFTNNHKEQLNKLIKDSKYLEYQKQLGKAIYILEIKEYLEFFKIDKDLTYTLKVLEFFNSNIFFKKLYEHLNFSAFLKPTDDIKAFSYGFVAIFFAIDKELCKKLFQKLFLHYQSSVNNPSNIEINFKDIVTTLAKLRKQNIKESFGEDENKKAFFKLYVDEKLEVSLSGKSIKTIRKKAYKALFEKVY